MEKGGEWQSVDFSHKALINSHFSLGMLVFGSEPLLRQHHPRGERSCLQGSSCTPVWQVGKGAVVVRDTVKQRNQMTQATTGGFYDSGFWASRTFFVLFLLNTHPS